MIISKKYIITAPTVLEKTEEKIDKIPKGFYLLKTKETSICKADLRYYLGQRPPEILEKAYPLCPFHEATAVIEKAGEGTQLKEGTFVIPVPNIPCYVHDKNKYKNKEHACDSCKSNVIGENYCLDGKFASSNTEGFARDYFLHPEECVVPVPKEVPPNIAILTELLSVVRGAIRKSELKREDKITVLGCGPLAYLTACTLYFINKIPKENIFVFGINDSKLKNFEFISNTVNNKKGFHNKYYGTMDKTFECAGSHFSDLTINQALKLLKPGGTCILVGVSEHKVPIATRDILSKNLTLIGISRSPVQDYLPVLNNMKNTEFQKALEKVIPNKRFEATSIENIHKAFRATKDRLKFSKPIINW